MSDADLLAHARARGYLPPERHLHDDAASNPMAVVDHELCVRGLSGLHVADAGVVPTVVSGNTNAACIMIGGKCADLMLAARCARGPAATIAPQYPLTAQSRLMAPSARTTGGDPRAWQDRGTGARKPSQRASRCG